VHLIGEGSIIDQYSAQLHPQVLQRGKMIDQYFHLSYWQANGEKAYKLGKQR
jgi:hypothetical protein